MLDISTVLLLMLVSVFTATVPGRGKDDDIL